MAVTNWFSYVELKFTWTIFCSAPISSTRPIYFTFLKCDNKSLFQVGLFAYIIIACGSSNVVVWKRYYLHSMIVYTYISRKNGEILHGKIIWFLFVNFHIHFFHYARVLAAWSSFALTIFFYSDIIYRGTEMSYNFAF